MKKTYQFKNTEFIFSFCKRGLEDMTQGKQGLLSWCSAVLILCISSYSLHSPRGLPEFSEYHTHMQAKRESLRKAVIVWWLVQQCSFWTASSACSIDSGVGLVNGMWVEVKGRPQLASLLGLGSRIHRYKADEPNTQSRSKLNSRREAQTSWTGDLCVWKLILVFKCH